MKPVATAFTNTNFILEIGTEKNDLPAERRVDDEGQPCIVSAWRPTDEEREEISKGADVRLIVWGGAQPPVAVAVENVE